MFLDSQLRRLETGKQRLVLRADLHRRLAQLEVLTAANHARRVLSGLSLGLSLGERLLTWLRKR